MRLIEGQLIHRRYRLDERIAQGGMGEVWRGYDMELGKPVAIKALRGDLSSDGSKLARLRAEAHNSANLAHPNIAALFEYYENDGIGYLVMEYVPGRSLAEIYKEQGVLDPTELLPILIQTARGLYVAHSHGVIHRDVKPANIMVLDNGQVKITDFGVSYSTNQEQITQDGMVVGTAQYISPEQAQGKQATAQSDIYSLGVVAYEGIAGHRPFTGASAVEIAAAHVNDPVPPLPDGTDPRLDAYVMRMLAKDPAERPLSALDVAQSLAGIERQILDLEVQDVQPQPQPRTPQQPWSRVRAFASAAAASATSIASSTPVSETTRRAPRRAVSAPHHVPIRRFAAEEALDKVQDQMVQGVLNLGFHEHDDE